MNDDGELCFVKKLHRDIDQAWITFDVSQHLRIPASLIKTYLYHRPWRWLKDFSWWFNQHRLSFKTFPNNGPYDIFKSSIVSPMIMPWCPWTLWHFFMCILILYHFLVDLVSMNFMTTPTKQKEKPKKVPIVVNTQSEKIQKNVHFLLNRPC